MAPQGPEKKSEKLPAQEVSQGDKLATLEAPHNKPEDQRHDLVDFIKQSEPDDPRKKEDFLAKARAWSEQGNAHELRTAGLSSEENAADPVKKHALLSSAFLERDKTASNLRYTVNFHDIGLADRRLGAGHLLPPEVNAIRVYDAKGALIADRAERRVYKIPGKNGQPDRYKIGYYVGESKYISIHSGYKIDVLETGLGGSRPVQERHEEEKKVFRYVKEDVREDGIGRDFWAKNCGKTKEQAEQFLAKDVPFLGGTLRRVNKFIVPYLKEAEARINAAGINYRADDLSAFNWRNVNKSPIVGGDLTHASYHCWAVAFDLNPGKNQVGTNGNIPSELVNIMEQCGFRWGGYWSPAKRDPMHFEFRANPFTSLALLKTDEAKMLATRYGLDRGGKSAVA